MSKRDALSRYSLIIKRLKRKPASFTEISNYLETESELQDRNFCISSRTFKRDMVDILSLYQIHIKFNFSQKVYYIESDCESNTNEKMLEAFDTFDALNIAERLSKNIHFEKRGPKGTEFLSTLLHAIKKQYVVNFFYHKFYEENNTDRSAEPYALKEFKNRWYLLAKDKSDSVVKTFSLDRISLLHVTDIKFTNVDFDVHEYFKYCYGIIKPEDGEPKDIILAFEPVQGKYVKTLPLHESQQTILDTKTEIRIQLKLYITHDFLMELLSFGSALTVIKPNSLARKINAEHQCAANLYRL